MDVKQFDKYKYDVSFLEIPMHRYRALLTRPLLPSKSCISL